MYIFHSFPWNSLKNTEKHNITGTNQPAEPTGTNQQREPTNTKSRWIKSWAVLQSHSFQSSKVYMYVFNRFAINIKTKHHNSIATAHFAQTDWSHRYMDFVLSLRGTSLKLNLCHLADGTQSDLPGPFIYFLRIQLLTGG